MIVNIVTDGMACHISEGRKHIFIYADGRMVRVETVDDFNAMHITEVDGFSLAAKSVEVSTLAQRSLPLRVEAEDEKGT